MNGGNEENENGRAMTRQQPQEMELVPPGDQRAAGAVVARVNADGSRELAMTGDTASASIAAQIRADADMRSQRARELNRDWTMVRNKLLETCSRPRFAKVAKYNKPVGKGIIGPSIRFAEEAMRAMGNLVTRESIVHEDAAKRIIRVSVYDFESNNAIEQDVTIEKTVERLSLKSGQRAISQRKNSAGQLTYLVAATEDELLTKKNAQVSKARRNMILQVLPGDILEDCMDRVDATLEGAIDADIVGERKTCADAFGEIGVTPKQLGEWLGHPLSDATAKELNALRAVYNAISAGEGTWEQAMEVKTGKPAGGTEAPAAAPAGKGVAGAKEKAKAAAQAAREPGSEG